MSIKYPAIFTDNIGCDKASVFYDEDKFYLEVRGCIFYCGSTDFEFYTDKIDKAIRKFYLKGNELIGFILDIRIPLELKNDNFNKVEKFILRIERQKNYYENSLLYEEKDCIHEVKGYNFSQLILRMKKELSKEYNLNLCVPVSVGI